METENYEMVKKIILNDQLEQPEKLKLLVIKNSLSDLDKERIKQAVLESVSRKTDYPPDELAKLTCKAIYLIDSYEN
ncbi:MULTISPECIES: hypothetical protein [Glaesserella]|uniref:Uncharacterized protein n=2 Tax=Glaesserella TaxID=2094023 RepID=A0A328BZM4_9PAST|nr:MULTISPECIES: hypothetical protein [Glaesserella]AUI65598.1 hypothetical protein CJD39_02960 [Glaesserella sp. 15-184]MDG6429382.1 hypothetical protein [Glaesserella parasuis]MDG6448183.1 hypothetical protein [Glaesserella parasuis]MDG6474924.1 hypothetical protein [Glaesserella parasuis]MDG6819579.1 hypothetical protein [Glaesserella parasuis]